MYTLFIDTHSELITVALYNKDKLVVKEKESYHSHAVYLVPMIKDIIESNSITLDNVKDIVCINGPGSFTGLRIGLSVGKTLAYSLDIPIYLISTLDAYLVSSDISNKIAVVEDNKGYFIKRDDSIEEYVSDITNFSNYIIVNKLDIPKVINRAYLNKETNPHLVRANYVKDIEVLK